MRIRVLGIVLAGGKGTRLAPLTNERAKPAVPFGGKYRIIDFMIEYHVEKRAEVTIAAIPAPKKHASEFGVIEADIDDRILAFHEKNPEAPSMPADSEQVYASMGNYVFSTRPLLELLREDARNPTSHHDFGKDILPKLAGNGRM